MIFETYIAGIPCQIEVTLFTEGLPMRITGSGFGDAEPEYLGEFEFVVRDRCGYRADWLADKMSWRDEARIEEEYKAILAMEAV